MRICIKDFPVRGKRIHTKHRMALPLQNGALYHMIFVRRSNISLYIHFIFHDFFETSTLIIVLNDTSTEKV